MTGREEKNWRRSLAAWTKQTLLQAVRDRGFLLTSFVLFPISGIFLILISYHPVFSVNESGYIPILFFLHLLAFWISLNGTSTVFLREREAYIYERLHHQPVMIYFSSHVICYLFLALIQSAFLTGYFILFFRWVVDVINKFIIGYLPGNSNVFSEILHRSPFGFPWGLILGLGISSITGSCVGLFISAVVPSERVALILVPIITVFVILYSPAVISNKRVNGYAPHAPLVQVDDEQGYKCIFRKLWKGTAKNDESQDSDFHPARFWGVRLSLFNPLRYSMNVTQILWDVYGSMADGVSALMEASFALGEAVLILFLTALALRDPRKFG